MTSSTVILVIKYSSNPFYALMAIREREWIRQGCEMRGINSARKCWEGITCNIRKGVIRTAARGIFRSEKDIGSAFLSWRLSY